jgi:hypothetical protein
VKKKLSVNEGTRNRESLWIVWIKCYINQIRLYQKWRLINVIPFNLKSAITSDIHADTKPWLEEQKNEIMAKQHTF